MLSQKFKNAYLNGLSRGFNSYYDDMNEYGNPSATHYIYFIPGLNGVAGQIRFPLPAANRFFQSDIYAKSFHLPEFSYQQPIWDKYTEKNLEKKIDKIVEDLKALAKARSRVMVFCSSSGFYDFYAAAARLDMRTKAVLQLFWVACAPDRFVENYWTRIFYRLNGCIEGGHKWMALPNSNLLRWLNPEAPYRHSPKAGKPYKYYYKQDIESRFSVYNTLWSYSSVTSMNSTLQFMVNQSDEKITIPTYVLAAENDGYWQGLGMEDMTRLINKYVHAPRIMTRNTSHLWIASPENIYELLQFAYGGNGEALLAGQEFYMLSESEKAMS